MDLTTRYLGLELKNPLVVSASPLSRNIDSARRLEDAGAAALVMYSLFEEELLDEQRALEHYLHAREIGFAEATSPMMMPDDYINGLDSYLEQLGKLKAALDIPVIASLNGTSTSGWIENGRELEKAGADALELNAYMVAADPDTTGAEIEARYLELLSELRAEISIPIAMKLSPQFSSVANMAKRLTEAGADGLVLFNRFYQPDIDLDTLTVNPTVKLSTPAELLLRMRWIALLFGRVDASLAATGGIHDGGDVLKVMLAGANVAQLCSTLLTHGPGRLTEILDQMTGWLGEHDYTSLSELIGSVSQARTTDPAE